MNPGPFLPGKGTNGSGLTERITGDITTTKTAEVKKVCDISERFDMPNICCD